MQRKKRRRTVQKNKVKHLNSMKLIGLVVFSLILVLGIGSQSAVAKNKAYMKQEQELVKRLEEEKNRSMEIEVYSDYTQTDEYVETVAGEKLGLAYPDQIILVPEK